MLIGRGFIAKNLKNCFKNKKNLIIYASGNSNSKKSNKNFLNKELTEIKKYKKYNKLFIYFSSIYINIYKDKYYKNKSIIEKYIVKNFKKYLIIRLPLVLGRNNNNNTLINYLYYNLKKNNPIYLYKNTKRSILDIEDVKDFISKINKYHQRKKINIYNNKFVDIFNITVFLKKKLNSKSDIIFLNSKNIIVQKKNSLIKKFSKNYTFDIISKYYF